MIRLFSSSIFILILTTSSYAQEFRSALVFGPNFSQIDGDNMGGYNKLGLNGGFVVKRAVNEKLSAQIEFLYSQKGSKRMVDENNTGTNGVFEKMRINYLELPLLATYEYRKIGFQAGLSIAYRINAKVQQFQTGGFENNTDSLKKTDLGFNFGIEYPLNEKWTVSGRNVYSIYSVINGHSRFRFQFPMHGFYNNVMMLSLRRSLK